MMPDSSPKPATGTLLSNSVGGAPQGWLDQGWAVLDAAGRVVDLDETLCRWLDLAKGGALGRFLWQLLKDKCSNWEQPVKTVVEKNETFGRIDLQKTLPGSHSVQSFQLDCIRQTAGSVVRLSSQLPPVNELEEAAWDDHLSSDSARREMFVRLLRTEAQLNSLIQRWPGIIFSQRPDCSFNFISPRIEEFTGVPAGEWRYQPQLFWRILHEADANQMQQHLRQVVCVPEGLTTTFRIRHAKSGRVAYIMERRQAILSPTGLLLGYDGYWLDITRQTIAEKRLSSSAWKETLAVLTMGLAHDFSNIMAGILSLSETFQAELGKDHPFYEGLTLIRDNSIQASQLIQRISQLHRGKPGEKTYIDLNEVAGEMVELVRKIVPKRISIQTHFAAEQLAVYADAVEFRQVFVNLALNAADAMPQRGVLTVETSRHDQYPAAAHVQGALPKLPAICMTVRDTGCGIPERNLESIFDPFYTTKEINKGSGLGLYNASLFVETHQGAISVESKVDEGTVFHIWLPQADFTEAERVPEEIRCRHVLLLLGANGTALDSMAGMLRQNGFCVVVTTSDTHAHEFLNSPEYHFSGVILQTTAGPSSIFSDLRRQHSPLKAILQVISCNPDEVDTLFIKKADLVLRADTSEQEMLQQIKLLVEGPSKNS